MQDLLNMEQQFINPQLYMCTWCAFESLLQPCQIWLQKFCWLGPRIYAIFTLQRVHLELLSMTRKIALSCFCTFSKVLKSLAYLFFQIFTEKSKRMTASVENPFKHIVEPLDSQDLQQRFYNLCKLGDPRYGSSSMNHISVLFTSLRSMITKVFTLSFSQSVCHFPSGSSWSLLSGTVMSFW